MSVDDAISVEEAAAALGVDRRAVRFMASAGEIDAVKRGNVWWLDRRSVERRRRQEPGRGRPLSPAMAWTILLLASGDGPGRAEPGDHRPARARRWLASHSLVDDAPRLRSRARRETFASHPSELRRLGARADVVRTGISAAESVGIHGGGEELEAYAPARDRETIVAEHVLEPTAGPVLMRWVPDELWPVIEGHLAPRAAVLVDLLEHDDPRARREAAAELRRL
jgi:excisionase family DNA binding protein